MTALTTLGVNFRSLYTKLIVLGAVLTLILLTYVFTIGPTHTLTLPEFPFFTERVRSTCTPEAYAKGHWEYAPRTNKTVMTNKDEALEFAGFEGCASSREVFWHLAADAERLYDRFPGVASWAWQPPASCAIRELDPAVLVKDLVEHGGWFLIGGESSRFLLLLRSAGIFALVPSLAGS